jgi:hypothetical protein
MADRSVMAAQHISAPHAPQPSSVPRRLFYIAKFPGFAAPVLSPQASAFGPAASAGAPPGAFHTVKRGESGETCACEMGSGRML